MPDIHPYTFPPDVRRALEVEGGHIANALSRLSIAPDRAAKLVERLEYIRTALRLGRFPPREWTDTTQDNPGDASI